MPGESPTLERSFKHEATRVVAMSKIPFIRSVLGVSATTGRCHSSINGTVRARRELSRKKTRIKRSSEVSLVMGRIVDGGDVKRPR